MSVDLAPIASAPEAQGAVAGTRGVCVKALQWEAQDLRETTGVGSAAQPNGNHPNPLQHNDDSQGLGIPSRLAHAAPIATFTPSC